MKKIAIIGTGIAGMGAAHYLKDKFEVTLFEKNNYVGGHTHTVYVKEPEQIVPIDTGFIVFNFQTYPNLVELFDQLSVPYQNSDMSFSVQNRDTQLEFCGSGLNGLFGQRKNVFSPKFIKLLIGINKFNNEAPEVLDSPQFENMTLGEYFAFKNIGLDVLDNYLIPMSSAIWSCPPQEMLKFPIVTLVRFCANHGLLGLNTHFQWKTVIGGSFTYRDKIMKPLEHNTLTNSEVLKVKNFGDGVEVQTVNKSYYFDYAILASHADSSLKVLDQPTELQKVLLSPFKYQKNVATLHTDENIMPKHKRNWSSWNYLMSKASHLPPIVTYYMNRLQNLPTKNNYFVTLNGESLIDPQKIIKQFTYEHPVFDKQAIEAQKNLVKLNEQGPLFFCGSYFKYGFHEDALTSAKILSEYINTRFSFTTKTKVEAQI